MMSDFTSRRAAHIVRCLYEEARRNSSNVNAYDDREHPVKIVSFDEALDFVMDLEKEAEGEVVSGEELAARGESIPNTVDAWKRHAHMMADLVEVLAAERSELRSRINKLEQTLAKERRYLNKVVDSLQRPSTFREVN